MSVRAMSMAGVALTDSGGPGWFTAGQLANLRMQIEALVGGRCRPSSLRGARRQSSKRFGVAGFAVGVVPGHGSGGLDADRRDNL